MTWTIWHNPRCRKSRETLKLLQSKGVDPDVRLYLKSPQTVEEIKGVLDGLSLTARALMRTQEEEYKTLGLSAETFSENELIRAMVTSPKIIERPVVIGPTGVALGRPPEAVMALFNGTV